MLLHDDVVGDGQAKASALASGLCREEGIEHLFLYLRRNADAVIANSDLDFVAKVLCRSHQGWLTCIIIALLFAFGRRIETVRDQVQESPRDFLGENIDLTRGRIKGPLQSHLEALLLCA